MINLKKNNWKDNILDNKS